MQVARSYRKFPIGQTIREKLSLFAIACKLRVVEIRPNCPGLCDFRATIWTKFAPFGNSRVKKVKDCLIESGTRDCA